jgi:hypothetical protein
MKGFMKHNQISKKIKKSQLHKITIMVLCMLAMIFARAQSIEIDCENFKFVDDPLYISGVVTINEETAYNTDVIVTSGSELIVLGAIYFGEGTKLIVERNAKLTIDGGLLSGACGFWLGVELHGTTTQPQSTLYQGFVEIINHGRIEEAINGIRTCKTIGGKVVQGYTGGIIQATDAEFFNNLTAIHFYPYPSNKVSTFVTCLFEIDAGLPEGGIPNYFVKMENVRDVKFTGCGFNNASGIDYLHNGIYAYNSSFRLEGKCTDDSNPCPEWENGWFQNLNYGVYALYAATTTYPDIRHQKFTSNKRGVYISGAVGARVTSNQFILPGIESEVDHDYGLYLSYSRYYHVEDNSFTGSKQQPGNIGLYIRHSGTEWNQVYRNHFAHLRTGTIAYGLNRNENGTVGLCIKCNEYEYNVNDIIVHGIPGMGHGIASDQGFMHGNDLAPAGNSFTRYFSGSQYNFMNSIGMGMINYVYHSEVQTRELLNPEIYLRNVTMSKIPNVIANYFDRKTNCPPKLDSTEMSSWRAWSTMYASETVLKPAIYKEDVFPASMVRDVLVANPQSAKSDDIVESLDNRWDQMPQWMMDQIMEGIDTTGAKEAIERNLAGWKHKRGEHFTNLYRHYLYDGVNSQAATDSLELLLSGDNSLNSKYALVMLYAGKSDYASMNAMIGSVTGTFALSSVEHSIHQDYATLCGILQQLDGNLPDEGSAHASALMLLAEEEEYFPGACARNLLIAAGLLQYQVPIILPDLTKSSKVKGGSYGKERPDMLKVFPNPARDFLVVDYNTDGKQGAILLAVTDMKGYTVHSEAFASGRDQVVVSTTGWKKGVYAVSLTVNGKPVANSKVTVQ